MVGVPACSGCPGETPYSANIKFWDIDFKSCPGPTLYWTAKCGGEDNDQWAKFVDLSKDPSGVNDCDLSYYLENIPYRLTQSQSTPCLWFAKIPTEDLKLYWYSYPEGEYTGDDPCGDLNTCWIESMPYIYIAATRSPTTLSVHIYTIGAVNALTWNIYQHTILLTNPNSSCLTYGYNSGSTVIELKNHINSCLWSLSEN